MAVGFDLGTANLLVARQKGKEIEIKRIRNAFIDINEEQAQRLAAGSLNAVYIKNNAYIVGDDAISIARILNRELRRPMASGILNPSEKEGRNVLSTLAKTLLGEPEVDGEKCCFSVPATPVDANKTTVTWHTGFFSQLLETIGYSPEPVNEALAIIYAECAEDDHSGIALSHGGGQINVCASYKLVGTLEFSIARGGDWIDSMTSAAIGIPIAQVLKVKEDPKFDLLNACELDDEIGQALYYHYKALIRYEIQTLMKEWSKMKSQLDFPAPIPIILSGGTASIKGFKELWEEELKKLQAKTPLPFKIKEVRMAADPLGAVARGLLTFALSY
jgi:actin-like ATPase involved in cell morphogenesis